MLSGNKTVTATYAGDKWYVFNSTTAQFEVSKVPTTVNVTVTDHYVDEAFDIIIENETAVVVTINGVEYPVVGGKVIVGADKLAAGHYIVTATDVENDKYVVTSKTKEFDILKRNSTIKVSADPINVGETAVIKITVPDDIDASVIVNVDGVNYTVAISGGAGSLELKDLKAGTHEVKATYVENDKYLTNSNATSITVSKLASAVTVNVDDITVGEVALINITVTDGATGNVTIKIGDEYEQTVGVVDGKLSVVVAGLTVGDKTVNVTYNGDDKYLSSNSSADFTVGKSAAQITVVVQNITYGETEKVVAYIEAEGNVTFKLNGNVIGTVDITGGKAEYSLSPDAGNYTVEVIYNGNANINSTSATANFTVAKAQPSITVEGTDIVYGDVETITINSDVDGTANVTVNGKTTEITLSVGSNSFEVSGLAAGKYPVEVTFNGNNNYIPMTATGMFNVLKANVTVDIEVVSSIKYNETQVINITVSNINATGNVTVNIDGVNYTVSLKDGKANFTTPVLPAGNHTVTVIYDGDGNFNGNWIDATFEVTKLEAPFTVTATDADSGSQTTIKLIGLPDDATGYVIVKVNGTEYGVNITQTKELKVPVGNAGTYDVVASYLGDDVYLGSSN